MSLLDSPRDLGFMVLPNYRGFVVFASLLVCLATWWLIERTRLGSYLRAGTENPRLVQAFGVNVPMMVMLTYGAGAGLAALAGGLQMLAHSAAHPELQDNAGNIALLQRAEAAGLLPAGVGSAAADAYRELRRVQHQARLDEQACSLRDSVVAISRLSSDVQNNAQAARELDGLTEGLSRQASSRGSARAQVWPPNGAAAVRPAAPEPTMMTSWLTPPALRCWSG